MTEARTGCARPRAGARWRLIALSTALSMMLGACSTANIPTIADAPPAPQSLQDMAAVTPASKALARELKRRGFRFVGPTTAYALMQATGIVNDHVEGCVARSS